MKLKEKWASLFIPKKTPYCHHEFRQNVAGNVYAEPCKYWCLKKIKGYEVPLEYCKYLKQVLYIQDQVKDCGINEDYEIGE